MLDFPIAFVHRHWGACQGAYRVPRPAFSLHAKGMKRYRINDLELLDPGPFLVIHPGDTDVEFESRPGRESWAIEIDTQDIRRAPEQGMIEIRSAGFWARLPAVTRLSPEQLLVCREEFQCMYECYRSPLPVNALKIRMALVQVLRLAMAASAPVMDDSPAARLKQMIDDDSRVSHSLLSLSRACGRSPSHLREAFRRKYGICPIAYRNRRRMTYAMNLMMRSKLAIKEIAVATGFRHLSHFSAMFRTHYQMSPREVLRGLRQQGRSDATSPRRRRK